MADFRVEMEGWDTCLRTMEELPRALTRRIIRRALRVAANLIRDEARRRAPIRVDPPGPKKIKGARLRFPGFLRKHIGVRFQRPQPGELTAAIGAFGEAFYGRFREMGTAYQPARPFLRPALDTSAQAALQVMGTEIMAGLAQETGRTA